MSVVVVPEPTTGSSTAIKDSFTEHSQMSFDVNLEHVFHINASFVKSVSKHWWYKRHLQKVCVTQTVDFAMSQMVQTLKLLHL